MLGGFIGAIITAWILQLFGVGDMIINVIQPFTSVKLTLDYYYVGLGLIGLVGGAFDNIERNY